jgi:hypothetical protein
MPPARARPFANANAGCVAHTRVLRDVVDSVDSRLLRSHESLRDARGGAVELERRIGEGVPEWVMRWATARLRSIPTRRFPLPVPLTETHLRVRGLRFPTQGGPFELFHSVNNV